MYQPAYVALPPSGQGPGVVVLHAWWGLTDFFTGLCDRLAQAGFVVAAPDLYNGRRAETVEAASQLVEAYDRTSAWAKVLEAVDYLRQHAGVRRGSLGVVGFSMGASWALRLSTERPEDVAAVVVFYGTDEADFSQARAAYQGHFAPADEWEPDEGVRALENSLRSAGREVTFYDYPGTGHWFFEDNRPENFDAEAARLAWERMVTFLEEKLAAG